MNIYNLNYLGRDVFDKYLVYWIFITCRIIGWILFIIYYIIKIVKFKYRAYYNNDSMTNNKFDLNDIKVKFKD